MFNMKHANSNQLLITKTGLDYDATDTSLADNR